MDKVIIALDYSSKEEVYDFLSKFKEEKLFLKVGMELYYKEGNSLIKELKDMGHKIFLDLKLYDIPNTVNKAIKNLVKLDVDFITVHTLGGYEMLKAASEATNGSNIKLLGVTILTSFLESQIKEDLNISFSLEDQVIHLANLAKKANIDGVVCSANEVSKVDKDLISVTPGIRMLGDDADDQKRIMTPQKAIESGSDYLVIGRSITKKEEPHKAYKQIIDSIK